MTEELSVNNRSNVIPNKVLLGGARDHIRAGLRIGKYSPYLNIRNYWEKWNFDEEIVLPQKEMNTEALRHKEN